VCRIAFDFVQNVKEELNAIEGPLESTFPLVKDCEIHTYYVFMSNESEFLSSLVERTDGFLIDYV
jgi:hypothetical protein